MIPATSGRVWVIGLRYVKPNSAATITTAPMAAIAQNSARQLVTVIITPASVGPIAGASIIAMPSTPMAAPSLSRGVIANVSIIARGSKIPYPTA